MSDNEREYIDDEQGWVDVFSESDEQATEELNNLRPCPFCGKTEYSYYSRPYSEPPVYNIRCTSCMALGPLANEDGPDIDAWNRRPIEDALQAELAAAQAEVERLREVVEFVLFNLDADHPEDIDAIRAHVKNALLEGGER